ncbi:hypothetical protein AX14_002772 [Amanita brunnescens Koide BX004]|nr:hypothetical protein AX14_002772 [Amanita brunnescens Koide BX004]
MAVVLPLGPRSDAHIPVVIRQDRQRLEGYWHLKNTFSVETIIHLNIEGEEDFTYCPGRKTAHVRIGVYVPLSEGTFNTYLKNVEGAPAFTQPSSVDEVLHLEFDGHGGTNMKLGVQEMNNINNIRWEDGVFKYKVYQPLITNAHPLPPPASRPPPKSNVGHKIKNLGYKFKYHRLLFILV